MKPTGRILIIDDDAAFIESYRDILGHEGYEVETATDRRSALTLLDRSDFDVVLLDQKLRGRDGPDDGLDLLAEISNHSPGSKTIIVTAFATPETIDRAFAAGIYDYLEKDGRNFSALVRTKVGNAIEVVRERRMGALSDRAVEAAIDRAWNAALVESDVNRKGKILEDLLLLLLKSVPGFNHVETRVKNEMEEIDLVVRNESTDPLWSKEGSYFLVECKNWSKPVGRTEIDTFFRKIERRFSRCHLGFFIAPHGFSEPADKVRSTDSKGNIVIVLVDGQDLVTLIRAEDRNAVLKRLHHQAVMATNGKNGH